MLTVMTGFRCFHEHAVRDAVVRSLCMRLSSTWFSKSKMAAGGAEEHFAKKLANNEKIIRDKAVNKLRAWIRSRPRDGPGTVLKNYKRNVLLREVQYNFTNRLTGRMYYKPASLLFVQRLLNLKLKENQKIYLEFNDRIL